MSCDLEARREARRQRILNNAQSRIRMIVDGEKSIPAERATNGPYNLRAHEHHQDDVSSQETQDELDGKSSTASTSTDQSTKNAEVKTIYVNPQPPRASSVNELYLLDTKEKTRRCIIILMALLMRCLMLILEEYFTYFFKTSFANFHLNMVFMPLLAFELIEIQYFEPPVVRFSSLSTLLLLKLNLQHTQKVLRAFGTIVRLSQDVVVYFVTFISFDFIISTILDGR